MIFAYIGYVRYHPVITIESTPTPRAVIRVPSITATVVSYETKFRDESASMPIGIDVGRRGARMMFGVAVSVSPTARTVSANAGCKQGQSKPDQLQGSALG